MKYRERCRLQCIVSHVQRIAAAQYKGVDPNDADTQRMTGIWNAIKRHEEASRHDL